MKAVSALVFATCLTALPAGAAVVNVTIIGTLGGVNVFNPAEAFDTFGNVWGTALVPDAAFEARFTFDTSVGTRSGMVNNRPADFLQGIDTGPLGNPGSGNLTIGTTTVNFESSGSPQFDSDNSTAFVSPEYDPDNNGWAQYSVNFESNFDSGRRVIGGLSFNIFELLGALPSSLETAYTSTGDPLAGGFSFPGIFGYATYFDCIGFDCTANSFVRLYGSNVTVTVSNGPSRGWAWLRSGPFLQN